MRIYANQISREGEYLRYPFFSNKQLSIVICRTDNGNVLENCRVHKTKPKFCIWGKVIFRSQITGDEGLRWHPSEQIKIVLKNIDENWTKKHFLKHLVLIYWKNTLYLRKSSSSS